MRRETIMINSLDSYTIGEFARKINVSTKTLARWDKSGLLVAERTDTNRRRYTQEHLDKHAELVASKAVRLTRIKNFPYKDITGEVFGKLTVIERTDDFVDNNGHRHIQWICKCECGEERVIKGASLQAGYNKSCGCSQYGDGETKRMWSEYASLMSSSNERNSDVETEPNPVGRKRNDISGQIFGWLTAREHGDYIQHDNGLRTPTWSCECDCGAYLDVPTSDLTRLVTISCGCMPQRIRDTYKRKVKRAGATQRHDITGQQFGFWTAQEKAETKVFPGGGRATRWLCECVCGNTKVVPTRDLKSGASQSCGCMTSMSWLEYYVSKYLKDNNVPHEYQKQYIDLLGTGGKSLSYDYLILDDAGMPKMLIECQGEQHYRPIKRFGGAKKLIEQQIHDKLKREYAHDVLGIPLKEVLYTCMTESEVIAELETFNL